MSAADRRTDPATTSLRGRTHNLLTAGVAAGPIYVVVGLVEALARPGFDLTPTR